MSADAQTPRRPIDGRSMPPVKGIDLEQSLNFISLPDVGKEFIYERYTGTRLPYRAGARPELEDIAHRETAGAKNEMERTRRLAEFIARRVPWAGYLEHRTGRKLAPDRGLTEAQIIASGYGWCNEQARAYCALTQVAGIPSRLVFAGNNARRYGHVISEVYLPAGWMAVDQSLPVLFEIHDRPVRACDIWHDPSTRAHFEPIYKSACDRLIREIGMEIAAACFGMAASDNPLDGFTDLGYHNHFVY